MSDFMLWTGLALLFGNAYIAGRQKSALNFFIGAVIALMIFFNWNRP